MHMKAVLPNQLEVFQLNQNETQHMYQEVFVERAYVQHGVTLEPGATVVDVGSNIGMTVLFFHTHCAGRCRILAFEPNPAACAALKANVERHNVDAKVFQAGVGRAPGELEFTVYPNISAMSGFYADKVDDQAVAAAFMINSGLPQEKAQAFLATSDIFKNEVVRCRVMTLEEVFDAERLTRVDLLKIDVEKSERDVLAGVADRHWPLIRQVILEVHDDNGALGKITGLLQGRGFEVLSEQHPMLKGTRLYNVYARRG